MVLYLMYNIYKEAECNAEITGTRGQLNVRWGNCGRLISSRGIYIVIEVDEHLLRSSKQNNNIYMYESVPLAHYPLMMYNSICVLRHKVTYLL